MEELILLPYKIRPYSEEQQSMQHALHEDEWENNIPKSFNIFYANNAYHIIISLKKESLNLEK